MLVGRREVMLKRFRDAAIRATKLDTAATRVQMHWRRTSRRRTRQSLLEGKLPRAVTLEVSLSALRSRQPSASSFKRSSSSIPRTHSILSRDHDMHNAATSVQSFYRGQASRRSSDSSHPSRSFTKSRTPSLSSSAPKTPADTPGQTPVLSTALADAAFVDAASTAKRNAVSLSSLDYRRFAEVSLSQFETPLAEAPSGEAKRLTDELAAVKARRATSVAQRLAAQREADEHAAMRAAEVAGDEAMRQLEIATRHAAEEKAARLATEEEARARVAAAAQHAEQERAARLEAEQRASLSLEESRHALQEEAARLTASETAARVAAEARAALLAAELDELRQLQRSSPSESATVVKASSSLSRTGAAERLQRFVRRRTLKAQWFELIEDLVGYHRLMRNLKETRAAKKLHARARGFLARRRVAPLAKKRRTELATAAIRDSILCLAIDDAVAGVAREQMEQAIYWARMQEQHAAAVYIQACARRLRVRANARRNRQHREQRRRDEVAVNRAIMEEREALARHRAVAATCIQNAHRGFVARRYTTRLLRVERPRAAGLADFRKWSSELIRAADLLPSDSWGFAHLGASVSRSELDELQLEAAGDHALHAHELGLPINDGARSGIRPLLVFDSSSAAEPTERVFPLELGSAVGRRRILLRQEMHGLTIDRETRAVLSRPLHKLWALGEHPELRVTEEQWLVHSEQHVALLEHPGDDALIVHFWELNGRLHAATRAGLSQTAARVEQYIAAQRLDYAGFAHCAISAGLTPVFAWRDSAQWAPTEHSTGASAPLVLLALRCLSSGMYVPYSNLQKAARRFRLPIVSRLGVWRSEAGNSFAEAISDLRTIAARATDEAVRRTRIPVDRDYALVLFENGYLATLALAQPMIHLASHEDTYLHALPLTDLQPVRRSEVVAVTEPSSLLGEWRSLKHIRRDQPAGIPDSVRAGAMSPHSAASAMASLQVEITLQMEGDLNELQRIGGGSLCGVLAEEMSIASERLELRAARLVRPGLRMAGEVERELTPCVEVTFEVLAAEDPSGSDLPASVAAAALLGSSRRRLGSRLGLPLLQLPAVRTEHPLALRTSRSTLTAYSSEPDLGLARSSPPQTLDPAELTEALRIVHCFVRERMGVAVPAKPPVLQEVMASMAAQAQLLQLLQAVLVAAERLPVDGSWRSERPALVGATSLLVLALQRQTPGFDAPSDATHSAPAARVSRGLPAIGNRALGALAHVGRAVDEAASSVGEVMTAATAEARQRAWSGASRPEPCPIRTFVRLRPPSTFEVLWARRSKRIGWGAKHADVRSANGTTNAPPLRVELSEVFEPGASQQRVYSNAVQPLVGAVLGGLNCALLCVGASGTGKTYTLYGTEAARADPLGAQRDEWGVAMRACEAFLQRTAPHTLAGPLAASAASAGATVVQMSFVELDGDDCFDLLRGGAPLSIENDELRGGAPHALGAAQLRVRSIEDAAYALRLGLRASHRGVLAPRTHTLLTLTVRTAADADGHERQDAAAGDKEARLVLVDLASGELHGPQRYRMSPGAPQTAASRSLAVLGACVAARAEGAQRGVPWGEAKITLLLREVLSGEFCTAVIGSCGAAEADTQATISTLHFLLHAGRLCNRVRVPQPPLESLVRRLRGLDERLSLHQQRWIERKPPVTSHLAANQPMGFGGGAVSLVLPATGGAEDLGPQHENVLFHELAAQVGLINQLREEQTAHLRAHLRDLRAAIDEAGKQRRGLPWQERSGGAGLSGAHDVLQRLEQAEQLVRALGEWLRESQDSHSALLHAVNLSQSRDTDLARALHDDVPTQWSGERPERHLYAVGRT